MAGITVDHVIPEGESGSLRIISLEKLESLETELTRSEGSFPNLNCHVQSGRVEEGQSKAVLFSESHSTSSDLQGAALETSTLDEIMPPAWSLPVDIDT
jgi:hypothetical protein